MLYHLYANNINFLLNLFLSSEEVLFKKYLYIVLLQDALNKQTFGQFRSYAEQQCPGNPDQQALLIKQLQEQHYYQYMQRYYQYYFLLPVHANILEMKAMQYTFSFPTKAARTAGSQWHFRRSPSSSSRIGEVTYDGHVTYVSFCVFHPFLSLPQAARGWYYRDERWHRRN